MFSDSYKMKLVSEVMYEVFGKLETRKLGDIQLVTKLRVMKNMYVKNSTFSLGRIQSLSGGGRRRNRRRCRIRS